MRRDALENAQDAQDAAELRRELREEREANRKLAEVVARQSATIGWMVAVLKGYEAWEAEIIQEDKCWPDNAPMALTQALYERLIELQTLRNEAIAEAKKGCTP
jgi:hypothetical protein